MAWVLLMAMLAVCLAAAGAAAEVPLWGRFERPFTAGGDFDVQFTAPSGKVVRWPAFWDGGRAWRVRFMPDEPGKWRFAADADPATGEFIVLKSADGNRFLRHGQVRVATGGTHLEHADGTPLFFLGDTAWNGPLLSTEEDWNAYLADRAGKKFTAVQFVMHAPWRAAPTSADGLTAFEGRKDIRINPGFYRRIDARMHAVEKAGLLCVPVLLWACTPDDPGRYLEEADAIRLIRYQVARYGAHHVLWILAGDGKYEGPAAERWMRIGRAVFGDGPRQVVAMHPCGQNWPYAPFLQEKWLDVLGYQSGHGSSDEHLRWTHSGPPATEWKRQPPRPVMNLEPPYEDHLSYHTPKPLTAYEVRRSCWWSILAAPPAGLTYGAHGIWSWQEDAAAPMKHANAGVAQPWHVAKDFPGSTQMKHLATLMESIRWWTLRPDPGLLLEQPGKNDPKMFISSAGGDDGRLAVFYLPAGGTVRTRAVGWTGRWFDPRSGRWREAQGEAGAFAAPEDGDWVLVLSRPQG